MLITDYIQNTNIRNNRNYITFCESKKKGDIILTDFQKYKNVNQEFNKESVIKVIKNRISSLPRLMNLLVSAPVEYIEEKVGANQFAKDYTKDFVPFAKRISVGENHKEYCENYKHEINMIKKVEKACDSFLNENNNLTGLNSEVEKALDKYSKTPIKRNKLFIA